MLTKDSQQNKIKLKLRKNGNEHKELFFVNEGKICRYALENRLYTLYMVL